MKYRDYKVINEAESKGSYHYEKIINGDSIQFDIDTDEDRKYRLIFRKKDDFYVSELGYQKGKSALYPIMSDFYDVNMTISTIVDIFTELHLDAVAVDYIVYKFDPLVDKAYILLMISLFKSDLKNYYSLSEHNDLSNINKLNRLIIETTRGQGQALTDITIEKMKKI